MVYALLQKTRNYDYIAAAAFWVASVTDFIDGWLARRSGEITNFGKVADPIADKLLVGCSLIVLTMLDRMPLWVTVLVIGRELLVTVSRTFALKQGEVRAAAWLGKVKTTVQTSVIFFVILIGKDSIWLDLAIYAMVAITLISAVDYFASVRRAQRLQGAGQA